MGFSFGKSRCPAAAPGSSAAAFIAGIELLGIVCQFHTDARGFGNHHAAVFKPQGFPDHGVLGAAQTEAGQFLDAQVGNAGAELQAGRCGDRPQGIVGDHQYIVGLCQGADLLSGGDAAYHAHIRAHILGRMAGEQQLKFPQAAEPFAGGNGHNERIWNFLGKPAASGQKKSLQTGSQTAIIVPITMPDWSGKESRECCLRRSH